MNKHSKDDITFILGEATYPKIGLHHPGNKIAVEYLTNVNISESNAAIKKSLDSMQENTEMNLEEMLSIA